MERFQEGLVFKAHRLLYHSALGLRIIKKQKKFNFAAMSNSALFRVWGSGSRVQGSGLRVQGRGFRVQGSGFRVQGSGFRVQGSGFRVEG